MGNTHHLHSGNLSNYNSDLKSYGKGYFRPFQFLKKVNIRYYVFVYESKLLYKAIYKESLLVYILIIYFLMAVSLYKQYC